MSQKQHNALFHRIQTNNSTRYHNHSKFIHKWENMESLPSGEIHSDWREVIAKGVSDEGLPVSITSPNTSHEDSDDCGAIILGMEEERRNWDKIGRLNCEVLF